MYPLQPESEDDDQGEDDASQDVGGVRAHEAVLGDANESSEQLGTSTEAIQRTVDGRLRR